MTEMLLVAINAKYIHSNLAVYSMRAYAKKHGCPVEVEEYTINHQIEDILERIYRRRPKAVFFSCYIWNIEYVKELAGELRRLLPEVPIWTGGPEVSFETEAFLQENPAVTGVLTGEGEETFLELCQYYRDRGTGEELVIETINGLVFRQEDGKIVRTGMRKLLDMDKLPFCYEEMEDFAHRIIYYESSRGCPYACSYCLSSVDKTLRFRSLELVLAELQFFIDKKVPQVKFVDRTFNCNHAHAMAIWQFLKAHDNGVTNFHFEVSADLFLPEELELIRSMRPGLVQFEIGVQTVNPQTIQEIHRSMNLDRLREHVAAVKEGKNVHQHLDLIAGLPYENYESFRNSFDAVYRMQPEQLQLGFLKVLKGSYMYEHQQEYALLYRRKPPYEVLRTQWLSYEEVLRLKQVEEVLELHYNSGQFVRSLRILEQTFDSPFDLYDQLGQFYLEQGYRGQNYSRMRRSEIFLEFAQSVDPDRLSLYQEALTFDLYARENIKVRSSWSAQEQVDKKQQLRYLRQQGIDKKYCHLECFSTEFLQLAGILGQEEGQPAAECVLWLLFDYETRDCMTNEAAITLLGSSLECQ